MKTMLKALAIPTIIEIVGGFALLGSVIDQFTYTLMCVGCIALYVATLIILKKREVGK